MVDLRVESVNSSHSDNNNTESRRNSYEENMKKFRELLMRENVDIIAKLKKYKKTDFRRKLVLDQLKELKKLSELSKLWVSVPYIKQTFDFPVITVDSSKAGSNIDALRLAINDLGWKEYPNGCNSKSCHVVWNSCNFNDNRNNIGSFVNKYPGITSCLHKVAFSRILETMRTLFPEHFNFYPLTWYLPHQMLDFSLYCKNRELANKKEKYYIVKPDNGTQGEGIYLIQRPQDYKVSSKTYVVQEYLANPLLLDGFKFDLRIYAILLSLDPLRVYLCNEGLARFCTKRYVSPSSDNLNINYMHLTNYSLNKKSNEFVHTQNLDSGSKRTVSSVFAYLEAEGYKVGNIWQKLEELVYKTVLAIVPQLKVHYINEVLVKSDGSFSNQQNDSEKDRPICFQILGFDVLIMEDLTPILLEVNSNPSMRLDCEMEIAPGICEYYVSKVDVKIKKPLVRDTLKLLQKEICEKFDLNMEDRRASKEWANRAKDLVPVEEDKIQSREDSSLSEKENMSEICRKWSTESEFGPHFLEIAKQNNTIPKHFEMNRSNSINDVTNGEAIVKVDSEQEIQVTITGTSPHIRKRQQQKRYDQLAREKSWLNIAKIEKDTKIDSDAAIERSVETTADCVERAPFEMIPENSSCLTLISTNSYKYLFDDLRILEETTIVFYNAMGHRYSENMGATAFRTFGRQCKLHVLGFNHAMIDLIYIEVQRRWSFINIYDSKQGLCYQAFLEAFFRIAFARFGDSSKCAAVQNLIDHCKRSIGSSNFNWTKTLNPSSDSQSHNKNYRSSKSIKRHRVLESQNHQKFDVKSNTSDSSSEISTDDAIEKSSTKPKDDKLQTGQSKYEFLKAIHQMYRIKVPKYKPTKVEALLNTDPDSAKSIYLNRSEDGSKSKPSTLPYLSSYKNDITSHSQAYFSKTYNYEEPPPTTKHQDSVFDRRTGNIFQREVKPVKHRTPSPVNNKSDYNSAYKMSNTFLKSNSNNISSSSAKSNAKSVKERSRSIKSQQLSPINNERMKKLISVYGAESQDFLKRSLNNMNKRFSILKPI